MLPIPIGHWVLAIGNICTLATFPRGVVSDAVPCLHTGVICNLPFKTAGLPMEVWRYVSTSFRNSSIPPRGFWSARLKMDLHNLHLHAIAKDPGVWYNPTHELLHIDHCRACSGFSLRGKPDYPRRRVSLGPRPAHRSRRRIVRVWLARRAHGRRRILHALQRRVRDARPLRLDGKARRSGFDGRQRRRARL